MKKERKILGVFLSIAIIIGLFAGIRLQTQAATSSDVTTVYFDNSVCGWSEAYAYVWGSGVSAEVISGTKIATNVYKFSIPKQYTNILFKNTSGTSSWDKQTADLNMPTADGYIFVPSSSANKTGGSWRLYSTQTPTPTPTTSPTTTVTVYFNNMTTSWSNVYAYVWSSGTSANVYSGTKVDTNIYKFSIPKQYTNILFKNTPGTSSWDKQTLDTYVPTSKANYYMPYSAANKTDGYWYECEDDTEELTANWSYTLSGTTISLNDYIGTNTEVTVEDYYYINGTKYTTVFPSSASYNGPFVGNSEITKVTFNGTGMLTDNSVPYLFQRCTSLTTVVGFGGNFTNMDNTFRYCSTLDCQITIPASVTSAEYAFYECEALSTMPVLPSDSQLRVADYMFYYCLEMEASSLTLPNNLTIMNGMFYNCKKLTARDIVIPDSVTEASYAFGTCEGLTVLPTINKSSKLVTATGMFNYCSNATSGTLYLPSTVTNAGYMFNNCKMLGYYTGNGFYLHSYMDATSAMMTAIFNNVGYNVHTGAAGTYGYRDCVVYVENASAETDAQYTAMAAYVNTSYMTIELGSEGDRRALVLGETSSAAVPLLDVTSMVEMFNHCTFSGEQMLAVVQYNDRTKAEITSQIKSMFSQNTENDISYIYFTCHGSSGGSIYIGSDGGYYRPAELRTLLDQYVKGDIVLMVDCCYSGNTVQVNSVSDEESDEDFVDAFMEEFLSAETSDTDTKSGELAAERYHVICSSAKDELSYGGSSSVATRYWEFGCGWDEVNGVTTSLLADTNSDNKVTLAELYNYSYAEVVSQHTTQHIVVYPENNNFVVAGKY